MKLARPVVTRAAEKETQNRTIGPICPFLPPRVFVKCPSIRKMDGRGGGDRTQNPAIRVNLRCSFSESDEFAQTHIQSRRQFISNFDPDADLTEFNRANVRPMYPCPLGEILLRKPKFQPFFLDCPAEGSSGEFCCLGHDILLVSCIRSIYRRSSTTDSHRTYH